MTFEEKIDALLKVLGALTVLLTAITAGLVQVFRAVKKLQLPQVVMRKVAEEVVEEHVSTHHAVLVPQLARKRGE